MSIIDTNENLSVAIKSMSLQDIDAVLAIEQGNFTDPWSIVAFKQCLIYNENFTLYSTETKEVLGYFIGLGVVDEYSIYNIAIKKSYQKKGLGTYLLTTIIDYHNKQYVAYYLEVRKSNEQALNYYHKLGFTEVYTRKAYYSNPVEDALVLKLRI